MDSTPADGASLEQLKQGVDGLFQALELRLVEINRREREVQALKAAAEKAKEEWLQEEAAQREALARERAAVVAERSALDRERERMTAPDVRPSDILTLNVGGERIVQRRRSTLCALEDSFLASRFSGRWEQELDRDEEGRHFINYSPELFLPLLDYLGSKETEDAAHPVRLPQGPAHALPQFEEMMRFFGMLPSVLTLDAVSTPYAGITSHDHGFAFEVVCKDQPLYLTALETSAGGISEVATSATVYVCQGSLARRLSQRDAWIQAGVGSLWPRSGSRVEFPEPVLLQANIGHCVYIATDGPGGVAHGGESRSGEICTENDDLKILAGKSSGSLKHFAGFGGFISWLRFNGKLEYIFSKPGDSGISSRNSSRSTTTGCATTGCTSSISSQCTTGI
jgi:hypothetical protein